MKSWRKEQNKLKKEHGAEEGACSKSEKNPGTGGKLKGSREHRKMKKEQGKGLMK